MPHYLLYLWLCLSNQMTILAHSNNNLLWSLSSPSAYTHIAGRAGPLPTMPSQAQVPWALGCPCSFGLQEVGGEPNPPKGQPTKWGPPSAGTAAHGDGE